MKILVLNIFVTLFFWTATSQDLLAQSKTSTSTSYSYSSSKSSSDYKSSRTSISISENDEYITVNARFNKHKTERIQQIVIDLLGQSNSKKGRRMIWDGVLEGLELSLSKGNLRLFYEKDGDKEDEDIVRDLMEEVSASLEG